MAQGAVTVDICVFDCEVIRKMFLKQGHCFQVSFGTKTPCFPKEKAVYRLVWNKPLSALGDLVLFCVYCFISVSRSLANPFSLLSFTQNVMNLEMLTELAWACPDSGRFDEPSLSILEKVSPFNQNNRISVLFLIYPIKLTHFVVTDVYLVGGHRKMSVS